MRETKLQAFYFALGKTYQNQLFLFSSEGIKSQKRSDHDGKAQKHTRHQICKGSHKHDISSANTKLDVAELQWHYMKVRPTFVWLPIFYMYQTAASPLKVFLWSPGVAICPPSSWIISRASKSYYYFLLWRRGMWVTQCHTSRQTKKLGAEKLQSLSPKQQATSPASVCNGRASERHLNCSS